MTDLEGLQQAMLEELGRLPNAEQFILGGGVALNELLPPPRATKDVDAWWRQGKSLELIAQAFGACRRAAAPFHLDVQRINHGDVDAFDFIDGEKKKVFSFQIALRDVALGEPSTSRFGALSIESLQDNLASKMSALVSRGAPRDFIDVKRAVDAGVFSVDDLWSLWKKTNPERGIDVAKVHTAHHLSVIEMRVPLDSIDPARRDGIKDARRWYRSVLLAGVPHGGRSRKGR